ncbi:HYR domain-containing protein [Aureibacter tunicatorum]|uniref:HYR domain-containing protein n=1 Tax=Aureibacter tunicatorum TaxID=866807 RepID=UPI00286BCCB7|nr:HYR domain-containing protein [Aureibacter tunicatorum]
MRKLFISLFFLLQISYSLFGQGFEYPSGYTYCKPVSDLTVKCLITEGQNGSFTVSPSGQGVTVNSVTGDLTIHPNAVIQDYTVSYTYQKTTGEESIPFDGFDLTITNGDMCSGFGSQADEIYISNFGSSTSANNAVFKADIINGKAQLQKFIDYPISVENSTRPETREYDQGQIALGPISSNVRDRLYFLNEQDRMGYIDLRNNRFYAVGETVRPGLQLGFDIEGNLYFGATSYFSRSIARLDNYKITSTAYDFGRSLNTVSYGALYNNQWITSFNEGDVTFDQDGFMYVANVVNNNLSQIYKFKFNDATKNYESNERVDVSGQVVGLASPSDGCVYYLAKGARELRKVNGLNNCIQTVVGRQVVSVTERVEGAEFSFSKSSYCNSDGTTQRILAPNNAWGVITSSPSGLVWADISEGIVDLEASKDATYLITNSVNACGQSFVHSENLVIDGNPVYATLNLMLCDNDTAKLPNMIQDYDQKELLYDFLLYYNRNDAIAGGSSGRVDTSNIRPGALYYVRGEDKVSDCFTVLPSDVVSLPAPEILSITKHPDPVCEGTGVDLNTVRYTSNIVDQDELTKYFFEDQSLTIPVPDPTNVTVTGTYWMILEDNLTGCRSTAPAGVNVIINPIDQATFSYPDFCANEDGQPYLDSGTVQGGDFSFRLNGSTGPFVTQIGMTTIDRNTGIIMGAVQNIDYQIRYSTASNPVSVCPNEHLEVSTALEYPTSDFSYPLGSYCQSAENPRPTISGTTGGVFSYTALTGGMLVIDPRSGEVNLTASDLGKYTIEYNVSIGNCNSKSQVDLEIIESPKVKFEYSSSSYCQGRIINTVSPRFLEGGSAGLFTSTPAGLDIEESSGIITLKTSLAGNYVVTNTIPEQSGCPEASYSFQLSILQSPEITLQDIINYCPYDGGIDLADPSYYTGDLSEVTRRYFNNSHEIFPDPEGKVIVNAGMYIVDALGKNGCATVLATRVIQLAEPTITIRSLPEPKCLPESFDLTSLDIQIDFDTMIGGVVDYFESQSDAVMNINPVPDPTDVLGTLTGKYYYIRADNTNGCFNIDSVRLFSVPRDDASFSFDDYCESKPNGAYAIATPGGLFSFANSRLLTLGISGPTIDQVTGEITGGVGGDTYMVKYLTRNLPEDPSKGVCPSSMVVPVMCLENPLLVINNPDPVCGGGTVDLSDPSITAGSSPNIELSYYFLYSDADNKVNPLTESEYKNAPVGTYYIRAEFMDGCYSIKPVEVKSVGEPMISFAIEEDETCSNKAYKLIGVHAENYSSFAWTDDGDGALSDENTLSPTYTPVASDAGNVVNITLTLQPLQGCPSPVSKTFRLNIIGAPESDAGVTPVDVCNTSTSIDLIGVIANGNPMWTSNGTGSFDDPTSATTSYNFSNDDYVAKRVELTLTVESSSLRCEEAKSGKVVMLVDSLNARFSYPSSSFCTGAQNPTPTVVESGGEFTANSSDLSINASTGEIDLSASLAGTYIVTYSLTSSTVCPNASTSSTINIIQSPDASFSYAEGSYCRSHENILPSTGTIGVLSASPSGLVFVDASTGEIDLVNSSPNTYTITNSLSSGGCVAPPATFDLTVIDFPALVINDPDPICAGEYVDLTSPDITRGTPDISSLTFAYYLNERDAWLGSNIGTVPDPTQVTGGIYYIRATNINTNCSNVKPVNVIENELPMAVVVNPDPICEPNTVDLFLSVMTTDEVHFYPTLNDAESDTNMIPDADAMTVSISGTYYARVENSFGCFIVKPVVVRIVAKEDPGFNFNDFCFGEENKPTDIVTLGGTFSFVGTVAGGAMINPSTGQISNEEEGATYVVQYRTNGMCPDSSKVSVKVKNLDDAAFTYGRNCDGDPIVPAYVVLPGGAFSINDPTGSAQINSQTGEVTNYIVGNVFFVFYETDGAPSSECPNSSSEEELVLAKSDPSFYYPSFCADKPVPAIVTGDAGGTFEFVVMPGDGATIDETTGLISNARPGETYTVSYTSPQPCPDKMINQVRVLPIGDSSFDFPDFCAASGGMPSKVATPGGLFSFDSPPSEGEIIDPATGFISNAKENVIYRVRYTLEDAPTYCYSSTVVSTMAEPVFKSCPGDIVISDTDAGKCSAKVFWTPPTLSTACAGLRVTSNYSPGDEFPVGVTTVRYVAGIDPANPVAICEFNILVRDNTPPEIENCGVTMSFEADPVTLTYPIPDVAKATDNCGLLSVTQSPAAGTIVGLGTHVVEVEAEDIYGKKAMCEIYIQVFDPSVICPPSVDVEQSGANCQAPVPDITGVFMHENPLLIDVEQTPAAGDLISVGKSQIHVTGVNPSGNRVGCFVPLNVYSVPVAMCKPADVYLDENGKGVLDPLLLNNGSFDPCYDPSELVFSVSKSRFECSDRGSENVLLLVTNPSGKSTSCSGTVSVLDTISPIVITKNAKLYLDDNGMVLLATSQIDDGSFDNCSAQLNLTLSKNDFDCDDLGANNVELTAMDESGSSSSGSAVAYVFDTIAPKITCPPPVEFKVANDEIYLIDSLVKYLKPEDVRENCTLISLTQIPEYNTPINHGNNFVRLEGIDQSNNVGSCQTYIKLNLDSIDFETQKTYYVAEGSCTIVLPDIGQEVVDRNPGLTNVKQYPSPGEVFDIGSHRVILTGIDKNGLEFVFVIDVMVVDQNPPVARCRSKVEIYLNDKEVAMLAPAQVDSGSFDLCSSVNVSLSRDEFYCRDLGDNTVDLFVEDAYGNQSYCTSDVFVGLQGRDTLLITGCPVDTITVDNDLDQCGANVYWTEPVKTVSCVEVTSNYKSGDFFPVGVTKVEYDAKAGPYMRSCVFYVKVIDQQGPVITCPNNIKSCESFVNVPKPTIDDNCPVVEVKNSFNGTDDASGFYPVGDTTYVTWTVLDNQGKKDECVMTVAVAPEGKISLPASDTVRLGDEITLRPQASGVNRFEWSPSTYLNDPNIENPICKPDNTITYDLKAWWDGYSECSVYGKIEIVVEEALDIPDVFTPDGDGVNDTFEIIGAKNFPNAVLQIYNRFGDRIFHTTDILNDEWDGTRNGSDLPVATYYYVLDLNNQEGRVINGVVTIIR